MTDEQKKLFGIEKLNIKRSEIPAVTHVDYSARIQTVHKETNKKYFELIKKFKEKTNCPIIVNTSFNVRGEPIVNTPTDAFNCFMGTDLDKLVIGNCYLDKSNQNPSLKKDYTKEFELDSIVYTDNLKPHNFCSQFLKNLSFIILIISLLPSFFRLAEEYKFKNLLYNLVFLSNSNKNLFLLIFHFESILSKNH